MAHLITGHAGKAHVKASDEARINKALYGNIEVAVDFGNNLAITLPSNNSVQIDTGLFYMQGRWIDIPAPEIVTFENGVAGMNRNDLVVLRYEMDSNSSVETAELVVKKGDSVAGTAADPQLEAGQIDSGALVNEVPLYRIPISSINIGEPVQLFKVKQINLDIYVKNSDVSTVSNDYVDIGVDNCTEVSASVCMTKLSPNIANIVINYKICSNTLATDVYRFIDMDKLKVALGLSYLGFPIGASTVILHPAISYYNGTLTEETAYANAEQRGLTGLMMDEGGGLCRIYQIGSTAGVWPLNCVMYKPGTYGTIIINGATIA